MANFGSIGEAFVDIRANLATLDKDLKQVGQRISGAGKSLRRTGLGISAAITLPIILIGVKALKTASDVQEMENLFRETFEAASKDVTDWARTTARAMQRSRFDLMQTAADFAAFLKPLGVAPKSIVPMSKALTALTTDLSSFRNIAEKDVFIALFSGLAGETESVRRLGIDIGAAAVETELLRLGINKTNAEASQAEKVMARFNLIMRQTTDAQGDAIRTTASFENQVRGLQATIKDIAIVIGERLLPVATRIVQKLRGLGEEFLDLAPAVQSGTLAIVAFVATIGPAIIITGLLLQAIGFAIAGFALLGPVVTAAFAAIKFLVIGVQVVVIGFLGFFATVPGLIITSLAAIVGGFFIFKDTIIGFFKGLILALRDAFVGGFNNLVVIPFQKAMNKLSDLLLTSPQTMAAGLKLRIGVNDIIEPTFKNDMKQVMGEALASGKQELEDFKQLASKVTASVKSGFGAMKTAVSDFLPDLSLADFSLTNIGETLDGLLAQFQAAANAAAGLGGSITDAAAAAESSWKDVMEEVSTSVENGLIDASLAFRSFGDVALQVIRQIAAEILRFAFIRPILAAIGLPIPALATGGDMRAGKAGLVGEKGPELFVPNVSGKIIPNNRLHMGGGDGNGGGGDTFNEYNFPMVFPSQLEAYIRNIGGTAGRDAAVQTIKAGRGRF